MKCLFLISLFFLLQADALSATPSWKLHTIDNKSLGADGVRMLDVNGDRALDVAVGWEEGGIVRAYINPGPTKFQTIWPAITVGKVKSPEDAVFADLDNDGAVDVVSSCEGKNRTMYVHWAPVDTKDYMSQEAWSTEPFPATEKKQSWMYALPMDIDGKHGIDLIVASKGQNAAVGWLQSPPNPRDLTAWTYHRLENAGWIMSLIAEDMDNDGDLDILVSDRKGPRRGVYWLSNPEWTRHDIGGQSRENFFISRGDVDQDGKLDVLNIDRKEIVWYRQTSGGWQPYTVPLPNGTGTGKSVITYDVDGDGKNDLVFSCENAKGDLSGVRWLSSNDSAYSSSWTSHEIGGPPGVKYDRLVPYDADGDGDLDLFCCEERDQLGVFWYENPFGE